MEKKRGTNCKAGLRRAVGFYMFLLPLVRLTVHSYFNHQGRNFRGVFPRKAQLLQSSSKGPLPFSRLKMAEAQKGPYELIPYQRAFSSVSVFNWHGSSSPKRSSKFQERRDDISPDHNEYNL